MRANSYRTTRRAVKGGRILTDAAYTRWRGQTGTRFLPPQPVYAARRRRSDVASAYVALVADITGARAKLEKDAAAFCLPSVYKPCFGALRGLETFRR